MSALAKSTYLSPESYLLGENDRPDGLKYEYVNGKTYLMAGASRGHNQVSMTFAALLFNYLRESPCQVSQSGIKRDREPFQTRQQRFLPESVNLKMHVDDL